MKKITITLLLFLSILIVHAQEERQKISLKTELKDTENANVYVDGKKFDFSVKLLAKEAIASVTILKEPETIKEYNLTHNTSYEISKNLILIATIKKEVSNFYGGDIIGYESNEKTSNHLIRIKGRCSTAETKSPLILIDGKRANEEELKLLEGNKIKSVSILKGEKAIEKFNSPNGVVLVATKKN